MYVCMYASIPVYLCMFTRMYVCMCTYYILIHTHVHTHMHTYIPVVFSLKTTICRILILKVIDSVFHKSYTHIPSYTYTHTYIYAHLSFPASKRPSAACLYWKWSIPFSSMLYIPTCLYMYIYIHIRTHTYMHTCRCLPQNDHPPHTCIESDRSGFHQWFICVCIYIYIYAPFYIYIYIYIYKHTHTHT